MTWSQSMVRNKDKPSSTHANVQDKPGDHHKSTGVDCIQVDAVHPLFKGYRLPKEEETSTQDDLRYHCKQCNEFFNKNISSVRDHFKSLQHTMIDKCVYCYGPVYDYYYNSRRLIYHSCSECQTRSS